MHAHTHTCKHTCPNKPILAYLFVEYDECNDYECSLEKSKDEEEIVEGCYSAVVDSQQSEQPRQ